MKGTDLTMKEMYQVDRTVLGTVWVMYPKKVLHLTLTMLHYNVQQLIYLTSCSY